MGRKESTEKVAQAIAQGHNATWTWEKLAAEVYESEGLQFGDRLDQCCEEAARCCRGFYPNRAKLWDVTFVNATPEARLLEYQHVIELMLYEADFTVKHRPIPPKPEPKPEPPKAPPPPGPSGPSGGPPAPPPPPPAA